MKATAMPDSAAMREGQRAEMLGMLDRALVVYRQLAEGSDDPDIRAEALWRQADVLRVQCQWSDGIESARRAQQVAAGAGLPRRHAEALNAEASIYLARGDLAQARALFETLASTADDLRMRGIGLQNLGSVHAQQGELDLAERVFAESHACFVRCGYERGQAIALNNQGRIALERGDHVRASAILVRAEEAARRVEDEELIALSTTNLADAALAMGDMELAHDRVCTALGHFRASGNRWRETECLRLLGTINERRGAREDARRCYERGLRLAGEIDARMEITALTSLLEKLEHAPED